MVTYISLIILVVVILFAFYQIVLSKDIKELLDDINKLLSERLPIKPLQGLRGCGAEPHRSNPKEMERREERIETSGAGALGGMVLGGVLGLPFGPAGIIIGGIIGALLGNQIEYESERVKRKRKKE